MNEGQRIKFYPGGNKPGRKGHYLGKVKGHPHVVRVRLDTDPYDVCVLSEYVRKINSTPNDKENSSTMAQATKNKPKAKDLRRQARALGVEDWEEMDLDELLAAVQKAEKEQAKKAAGKKGKSSKKAAAAVEDDDDEDDEDSDDDEDDDEDEAPKSKSKGKKATKKAAPTKKTAGKKGKKAASKKSNDDEDDDTPENGNPFQKGSNLYWMTEELIKGGKRSAMVKRLQKKITLKPRTRDEFDDEEAAAEIDRRLVIVSQVLRNDHGFSMEREGRGADTQIRLWKD